jgi:ferredoxin
MMAKAFTLQWNPTACDGLGYCAELLPDLIGTDEWGYPIVASSAVVPPELLAGARQAVKFCPRRALTLVEVPVRFQGNSQRR